MMERVLHFFALQNFQNILFLTNNNQGPQKTSAIATKRNYWKSFEFAKSVFFARKWKCHFEGEQTVNNRARGPTSLPRCEPLVSQKNKGHDRNRIDIKRNRLYLEELLVFMIFALLVMC